MDNVTEKESVEENLYVPSTPPKGLVCGRSGILPNGDLPTKKFKLFVDIFDELGSAWEKSGVLTTQSNQVNVKIQEVPKGDALVESVSREVACSKDGVLTTQSNRVKIKEVLKGDELEVKSVIGEVACSKDEIQSQRKLHTVVVGLSFPARAPSTPLNKSSRKRCSSGTPLKQRPQKRRNTTTDKPEQNPKLKNYRPKILNDKESQAALKSLDMYSAVKMHKRRLAGSTQRPFGSVKVVKRVGLANKKRCKKLQPSVEKKIGFLEVVPKKPECLSNNENHGQVMPRDQNVGTSTDPQNKHKFRAKVDLDEESERVSKLIMSNGGNTYDQEAEADSEKKENWVKERHFTRIRVESFISTIGMIQGDRSFSPWKGSVVDSVVGAYLTQNVNDHFSSSAFMSLAARFPRHKLNGRRKDSNPESHFSPSGGETSPKARRERDFKTMDVVDWESVRRATVDEVAETIKERGMNNVIAGKIKEFLDKIVEDHGSIDLEWLRDVPPEVAKNYLLNIYGIGLKSAECIRLLTLHHVAFPVDTNVGRVAVRLGWVPLKPLPGGLQMHLLDLYPLVNSIQKYLYPRLCTLDQEKLYLLHYHLITFAKVFCTKKKPNCNACPMRGECKYFASAFASHSRALPAPESKNIVTVQNPVVKPTEIDPGVSDLEYQRQNSEPGSEHIRQKCEPIIEHPASPEPSELEDIEDIGKYDDDGIPIIRIDNKSCMKNIIEYAKRNNISFEGDLSKMDLLNSPAPLPMPPLKHVGRLRTLHQVYELPDHHPILNQVDIRDPDDPSPYLFSVWNEGERRSSTSHTSFSGQEVCLKIECNCSETDCESLVYGTLMIPVRTANHGTFPLNGTYFQVNEVFADNETTERPIVVPRDWLWGLPKRNLYCGTSPTTTFKGFTLYHIQHALCKGYYCNRGFNRKTGRTTPLGVRFHINTTQSKKKVK